MYLENQYFAAFEVQITQKSNFYGSSMTHICSSALIIDIFGLKMYQKISYLATNICEVFFKNIFFNVNSRRATNGIFVSNLFINGSIKIFLKSINKCLVMNHFAYQNNYAGNLSKVVNAFTKLLLKVCSYYQYPRHKRNFRVSRCHIFYQNSLL